MTAPITGRKVFAIVACGFAIIIGVNVLLAVKAVATFPGLETKNSYVASQSFDRDRRAQEGLGWVVVADLRADHLLVTMRDPDGRTVRPAAIEGALTRPTNVAEDIDLDFEPHGDGYRADIVPRAGNWTLRLRARSDDGVQFRQTIALSRRAS